VTVETHVGAEQAGEAGQVEKMVLGLGADAYGYELKEAIRAHLAHNGRFELKDFGVDSADASAPYPEVGLRVAEAVAAGTIERAILVCGTGIGMAISANKVSGVRATVAYDPYSVERSVLSNNCQILALGGRVIGAEVAIRICDQWLQLHFDTSSPSATKLAVIARYESGDGPSEQVSQ
jgi:ribose 5-phosphate isomerase B